MAVSVNELQKNINEIKALAAVGDQKGAVALLKSIDIRPSKGHPDPEVRLADSRDKAIHQLMSDRFPGQEWGHYRIATLHNEDEADTIEQITPYYKLATFAGGRKILWGDGVQTI